MSLFAWRFGLAAPPKAGAVVVMAAPSRIEPLTPTARDLAEAPAPAALRRAFLARRGFARRCVAARLGVDPASVVLGHASSGAPILVAPDTPLHLSMSGREDFCAVALADCALGVDMEPLGDPAEPAWNILHEAERRRLASLAGMARHDAFLRVWTAKEACLKVLGQGLAREPAALAIHPEPLGARAGPVGAFVAEDRGRRLAHGEWRQATLAGRMFIVAAAAA